MTDPFAVGHAVLDDAAIGAGLRAGDEPSFTALYERYAQRIHDYAQRLSGDPTAAEDLTQMTFLQAWQRRQTLREGAAVRGWLYRIAHNLAVNQATRTRRAESVDDLELVAATPGPEDAMVADEAAELVWDAAASLQANQYAFLDLSLRHGLSTTEMSEVLGMSTAQASLGLNRAKEALGNAVRYLLVARRRQHCPRLAELVPQGVRRLSPEERMSVDRHMRRCDDCQKTARLVTAPEALFGGVAWLPLPPTMRVPPLPRPGSATHSVSARPLVGHPVTLGGVALAVAAAAAVAGVVLTHRSAAAPSPPSTPQPVSSAPSTPSTPQPASPAPTPGSTSLLVDVHTVDWSGVTIPASACGTSGPVQLRSGRATAASSRWPGFPQVTIYAPAVSSSVAYGDIDGTGHDDAALLVVCDTGGFTGGSTLADNLVVYSGSGGVHAVGVLEPLTPPTDGVSVGQFQPGSIQLSLHRVTVAEQDYAAGDPNCCPSRMRADVWSWDGNQFSALLTT